ncbi:MAG: glycosyltransferase family 2 protein [Microbacterium sp.]
MSHVAVSVVVPVFNPGAYMEPLLQSLDRQSMPAGQFEVVFVDDGSTDGTAALLDGWCASHPHAMVIHQENHGWPGQPRNVGLDASQGEYVQFVDQDDWLTDRALEHLYAYAVAHRSDIVIGKMVGEGRRVPKTLFRTSIPQARIGFDPLHDSLTPHKMFRRAFLNSIPLRFPTDTRRLEDHLFVTTAYVHATSISVYADEVCYVHTRRDDRRNAGLRPYDPVEYYAVLEEALAVLEAHVPPGPEQDRYANRWLRVELAGRLASKNARALPAAQRATLHAEIQRMITAHYPPQRTHHAPLWADTIAALVRHASPDEVFSALDAFHAITVHPWASGGDLALRLLRGDRGLPDDLSLRGLLGRTLPATVLEKVVDDIGPRADHPLLPPTVTAGPSGEAVLLQRSRATYHSDSATIVPGMQIKVSLAVGDRTKHVRAQRRRRFRETVAGRSLRHLLRTLRRRLRSLKRRLRGA